MNPCDWLCFEAAGKTPAETAVPTLHLVAVMCPVCFEPGFGAVFQNICAPEA